VSLPSLVSNVRSFAFFFFLRFTRHHRTVCVAALFGK
jgi:hypothetical protein